jgi:hypothetical protein
VNVENHFLCSYAKNVNKLIIYCCLKPIHKVGNNIASLLLGGIQLELGLETMKLVASGRIAVINPNALLDGP